MFDGSSPTWGCSTSMRSMGPVADDGDGFLESDIFIPTEVELDLLDPDHFDIRFDLRIPPFGAEKFLNKLEFFIFSEWPTPTKKLQTEIMVGKKVIMKRSIILSEV